MNAMVMSVCFDNRKFFGQFLFPVLGTRGSIFTAHKIDFEGGKVGDEHFNSRLIVTSVTEGRTQKLPPKFKVVETYGPDMTIHWKACEEHFLMVPLFFRFNHFCGKMHFLNFSQKNLSPLKS
jgi:hypothetical protein